jgi:dolichol-phosphate mannosyltransferase
MNQGLRKPRAVLSGPDSLRIGVVIPAHDEAKFIVDVIRGIPPWVTAILVVDDASRDDTAQLAASTGDPRVTVLRHAQNQGVGGAMLTGFGESLARDLDVVFKMDGDGQMDPADLPALLDPLIAGTADVVRGNRYANRRTLAAMPFRRAVGNAALAFLVKAASGYWDQLDPANGYLALRTHALREIDLGRLARDFYFESGLLVELGTRGAVVKSVPIPALYGDERSDLNELRVLGTFPPRLLKGFLRRILHRYFLDDFSAVSIFLMLGLPLLAGGFSFGVFTWWQLVRAGEVASAGTVMLAALPFLLGFELLLQATVLDVQGVPRTPISPPLDLAQPGAGSALPGRRVT